MKPGHFHPLDLATAVLTLVLAAATIYAASFPIVDTIFWILFALAWPFAALLWSMSLVVPSTPVTTNPVFSVITAVLLALAVGSFLVLGFFGLPVALLIASIALTVYAFADRRGRQRVGWLISPVLVIATIVLLFTGVPRLVRFHLTEPQLTAFAEQVMGGQALDLPWYGDQAISIGGISIYEADAKAGGIEFVTGYVGILGDAGAGLAYLPYGPPPNSDRYQHLDGPWYRWAPY